MGMYDNVSIFYPLPDKPGEDYLFNEWQSKSLECNLDNVSILGDGSLCVMPRGSTESTKLAYSGIFNFHQTVGDVRVEYDALYNRGELLWIERKE